MICVQKLQSLNRQTLMASHFSGTKKYEGESGNWVHCIVKRCITKFLLHVIRQIIKDFWGFLSDLWPHLNSSTFSTICSRKLPKSKAVPTRGSLMWQVHKLDLEMEQKVEQTIFASESETAFDPRHYEEICCWYFSSYVDISVPSFFATFHFTV